MANGYGKAIAKVVNQGRLYRTRRRPDVSPNEEEVFGLNAAKLFAINVEAKRKDLPKDYLSHIKMAYLEKDPSPSHHAYGWIFT